MLVHQMPYHRRTRFYENGGNDLNTKLLLNFNGGDGATTTADEAQDFNTAYTAKVITFAGTAQLDTAQYKFGTSRLDAASLLLDGNSDYVYTPAHADLQFGTGNFTIDFFWRAATVDMEVYGLCSQTNDASNFWGAHFVSQGSGVPSSIVWYNTAANWASLEAYLTPLANTWYHHALVRSGNTLTVYHNGTGGTPVTDADSFGAWTSTWAIGIAYWYWTTVYKYFNGWIDQFRVSNVARWTANFTPPTTPYR